MPFSAAQLSRLSQSHQPITRLWLAYSGGIDSHVLLHRCMALQNELPRIAGAIHIHHGISAQSDTWAAHCQQVCADLKLTCHISHVELTDGEGLEDRARRARYAALKLYLQAGDAVLLAQHQEDQAETFLLQALRGGGPRGLAAMPAIAKLGEGYLMRPMLDVSKQEIHDYAKQHHLQWVEDESNQDARFDRNYLRHEVMPVLRQRWPAADRTLSRTATHTAGLVDIADELLIDELQDITGSRPDTLSVTALKTLSFSRASLLIRALCEKLALPVPATAHLKELLDKQLQADADRQIHIDWPGAEIRRYQDDLYLLATLPPLSDTHWCHEWDGMDSLEIPELHGRMMLEPSQGEGFRHQYVELGLHIRPRIGGERCKPAGDSHRRELKTIYQDHCIPPWQRQRLPLIYSGDSLIAVSDIIVSDEAAVAPDETGYKVIWQTIH